jgi:hypothetical protein
MPATPLLLAFVDEAEEVFRAHVLSRLAAGRDGSVGSLALACEALHMVVRRSVTCVDLIQYNGSHVVVPGRAQLDIAQMPERFPLASQASLGIAAHTAANVELYVHMLSR